MRLVLRFVVGLVVILALVWLGLWWYAEGRMESGVAAWADGIAAKGGQVSYDSLKRGTSPGTAAIRLTNVSITTPPTRGGSVVLTLPTLGFRIGLFDPLLLHLDLPNRITAGYNGFDTVISFGGILITEQLDPRVLTAHENDPFRGGDVNASDVDVLASGGSLLVLHLDSLRSPYAFDRTAGAGGVALSGRLDVDGIALSPLLTHLLSIPFDGRIAHLGYGVRLSGPVPAGMPALAQQLQALPPADLADRQRLMAPVIRKWAAAGGNGAIDTAATIGPMTANGAATVKFDANVQPEGTADLTATHLDGFTAAIIDAYPRAQGIVAQLEAELSPYITSTAAAGQTLAFHALYGNGGVTVAGKQVAALPPVDWDALENPPPPSPPSPPPSPPSPPSQ